MATYDFSNLDFESLKQNLIDYIKLSDDFKDYDFEGSALNSIASLLTYTMLQFNYYLNMTTQELYLNTATIYKNVVAIAKSLNYTPHRKVAARLTTTIAFDQVEGVLNLDGPIVIPQNCSFLVDGINFLTETSYNIYDKDPINIQLFQRELITESYSFNNNTKELLYGTEIDEDYVTVKVNGEIWTEYQNQIDADGSSKIYFINTNLDEKLELSFGDNTIGKTPTVGNNIEVIYGITEGASGNSLTGISLNQTVYSGPYSYVDADCTIVDVYSSSGADEETIQSIKANAPKFYESQSRAITKQDYQTILKQLAFLETINIWDGADEFPPTYGTVFSSFKPTSGPDLLTDIQKSTIQSFIQNYMPMTLKLSIVDPVYIYIDVNTYVYYYKSYKIDTTVIQSDINQNVIDYFSNDLTDYETLIKYSRLIEAIDAETEVSHNLTDLTCYLKFDKSNLASNYYEYEVGNAIKIGSLDNIYIKDDSLGNIIQKSDSAVVGTIDYETGIIKFVKSDMDETNNILYFQTAAKDIYFRKNVLPVLGSISFAFEGV